MSQNALSIRLFLEQHRVPVYPLNVLFITFTSIYCSFCVNKWWWRWWWWRRRLPHCKKWTSDLQSVNNVDYKTIHDYTRSITHSINQ